MKTRGVAIKYGDIAPEAKENFVASTADKTDFVDLSFLQKYNLSFPNFANPCELYSVVLNGESKIFPQTPENENMGLWSEQLSNLDGSFTDPIILKLTSNGQYSSQGLTFTFDTNNQIYPTHINVHWWRDTNESLVDLGAKDFYPDNALYFAQNKVENYNRVVITFTGLNMPHNRLKLRSIDYGYGTFFYGDELRNVKLIQEIDPISSEISINTADFMLNSKRNIEYLFQSKQPLNIYFNGELKATTFVKNSKRKSKNLWQVQSEDYIGFLDGVLYNGGMYSNAKAINVLTDIFNVAKVPFNIDNIFENITITGYIPYTTCRNALMQVAFAIQAVVDTSNSEFVKVFALEDDVKQTIPLNRIMQGQNFDDGETVTGVEVTSHTYKQITDTLVAYDATASGTGQNIFVTFSEPLHSLSITNGSIVSSGTNFAVINASANCVLTGRKYEHTMSTKRLNNPMVLASEIERIVSVENATLVSPANLDNVLEKCYNWITRVNQTNLKIVEGRHNVGDDVISDKVVNVGDIITTQTEYLGEITGRIIKQTFNLNGGIIIKEAIVK